ncbi:MAG: winged helix-turn-helix transcriptional regulator [Spirochaetales bacterium]|nr:winged helix-turn-helix transcriptional regulator [Spirochaetales bacterium]
MQEILARFKALGDSNRFRIAMLLCERPLCVCELLSVIPVAGGTMSMHLRVLQHAGIIESRKDGRWIEYYIARPEITDFLKKVRDSISDKSQLEQDWKNIQNADRSLCSRS